MVCRSASLVTRGSSLGVSLARLVTQDPDAGAALLLRRTLGRTIMLMRQAALLTALAAAGQAAFDACGEPTKGPVLGGIDIVDAWAKALKARNATAPSQGPRLPHMAEAPPLRGSAEHAFTTKGRLRPPLRDGGQQGRVRGGPGQVPPGRGRLLRPGGLGPRPALP